MMSEHFSAVDISVLDSTDQLTELTAKLVGPPGLPGRGRPGRPGPAGLQGATGLKKDISIHCKPKCRKQHVVTLPVSVAINVIAY